MHYAESLDYMQYYARKQKQYRCAALFWDTQYIQTKIDSYA